MQRIVMLLLLILTFGAIQAQLPDDELKDILNSLPHGYLGKVAIKGNNIEQQLDKNSERAVEKYRKEEEKIQRKLSKTDSVKAKQLLNDAKQQYAGLKQKLKQPGSLQQYIPSLDTLSASLKFLLQKPGLLDNLKGTKKDLENAFEKVKSMEEKFQRAENVKRFLSERKQYLTNQLEQFGYAKELQKLNKCAYYYAVQLNEYKQLLKDHKKAERKVIELLNKTRAFQKFMRTNSQLASLFRLPADPGDPVLVTSLAGLQTRDQVSGLIQQQMGTGSQGNATLFQQYLQQAQNQLSELKNKMNSLNNGSSEDIMPQGFKPNNQKTKNFLQRLEIGANVQSQKANGFFPISSDIGLSIGYKLNDKCILGMGASYKMGWGQNIRHISITHQGIGLRSFIDWKIKGSFWLSGGYEMNYRNEFNRVAELRGLDEWQRSGLLGVTKKISLKTRFFRNTKIQLLWDFMSYRQVPRTQPIIFRLGYSFN